VRGQEVWDVKAVDDQAKRVDCDVGIRSSRQRQEIDAAEGLLTVKRPGNADPWRWGGGRRRPLPAAIQAGRARRSQVPGGAPDYRLSEATQLVGRVDADGTGTACWRHGPLPTHGRPQAACRRADHTAAAVPTVLIGDAGGRREHHPRWNRLCVPGAERDRNGSVAVMIGGFPAARLGY
jgi:hypothetical protein